MIKVKLLLWFLEAESKRMKWWEMCKYIDTISKRQWESGKPSDGTEANIERMKLEKHDILLSKREKANVF